MSPSAKSLIIDLLSTLPRSRRGSMPVRALVAAGRCFGIAENSVRVALARLHRAGSVDRDERGRYRLGARTEAIRVEVAGWKTRHQDVLPWTRRAWVGVFSPARPGRAPRAEQVRRERALMLLGFRRLDPGLQLRPDNLAGGAARTRERLLTLDPTLARDGSLIAGISDLDPKAEARALALWNGAEAIQAYRDSLTRVTASEAQLAERTPEEAMVETFLLGGQVLRQIALDPLLPEPIVPAAERDALVEAMRRYDELGRACWADFLARFDVPHLRTPTDLRVAEASLGSATSVPSPTAKHDLATRPGEPA